MTLSDRTDEIRAMLTNLDASLEFTAQGETIAYNAGSHGMEFKEREMQREIKFIEQIERASNDAAFGHGSSNGLSKREYYAAMAMQGLLAVDGLTIYQGNEKAPIGGIVAAHAVMYADDLILALAKGAK